MGLINISGAVCFDRMLLNWYPITQEDFDMLLRYAHFSEKITDNIRNVTLNGSSNLENFTSLKDQLKLDSYLAKEIFLGGLNPREAKPECLPAAQPIIWRFFGNSLSTEPSNKAVIKEIFSYL